MTSVLDVESNSNRLPIDNSSSSGTGSVTSQQPRPKKCTNVGTDRMSGREDSKIRTCTVDGKLPQNTSRWNDISHLESVGIYYKESALTIPEIFDMVHRETGMFGPLTAEKRQSVKKLQDQVNFSFSIHDLYKFEPSDYLEDTKKSLVRYQEEIKKQVVRRDEDKSEQSFPEDGKLDWPDLQQMFLVQDFTENTVLMLHFTDKRDVDEEFVSEAVFVDLFKSFVKMSGFIPSPGAEWKSSMRILQHQITSEADVVILVRDLLSCNPYSSAMFVVSVVEVKNITGSINKEVIDSPTEKTRPQRRTDGSSASDLGSSKASNSDFEKPLHKQPAIFRDVSKKVLAQHGGELLLHANAYGRKFRCLKKEGYRLHPGMIVIGTQVIFTLLEYSTSYFQQLKNNECVEKGKSYIYYSQPKDFLKKEDRNELLESLARLRNIKSVRPSSATF